MPEHILAIDAGTTSVRALLVRAAGEVVARAGERYSLIFGEGERAEQDAEALWEKTAGVIQKALTEAHLSPAEVAAIAITAQRGSVIVWERATGKPVSPLVSWQDMRGRKRSEELLAQGMLVVPQMSASKLEGVLDAVPDGRARMNRGELCWGNVESFVVARLTGEHVTDASHACVTGYYDYNSGTWLDDLIAYQGLAPGFFPELVQTSGICALTRAAVFGASIPIAAIVADQQSALIGETGGEEGSAKITLGTSGTFDAATGNAIHMTANTYPVVLERTGVVSQYGLEGIVVAAGSALDWLAREFGLGHDAADVCRLAEAASDGGDAVFLPGLDRFAAFPAGPPRAASKAQLAHAALEGVAFRLREIAQSAYSVLLRPPALRVDGGASESALLVQIIADRTGFVLERLAERQATALGAAFLADRVVRLLDDAAIERLRRIDGIFEPRFSEDERQGRYAAWAKACGR